MTESTRAQIRLSEAARYALLRRLAPAIRHDLAGALQPISMVAALLEKRLQKPAPDLSAVEKNVRDINALARDASVGCMQTLLWLAPKPNEQVGLGSGVADALQMVTTELSLRRFAVVDGTVDVDALVSVNVVRGLLIASLLTLTDNHEGPAEVAVTAQVSVDGIVIVLDLMPLEGDGVTFDTMPAMTLPYRTLDWGDVAAMADADGVRLVHEVCRVVLHCPAQRAVMPD